MPTAIENDRSTQVPLAVDLDGTLIRTDMMWESFARLPLTNPLAMLMTPFWLLRGRAYLKQQLAARVHVEAASLPYHEEFLNWLRQEKRAGRKIVLATASDVTLARRVAEHVGLFDEVIASDGQTNLRDHAKRDLLTRKFGERGFDYAGNSAPDLDVWSESREAIVVNASHGLAKRAAARTKVGRVFSSKTSTAAAIWKCLRPHQWLKNLIILVPAVTAHKMSDSHVLVTAALAILAFCLCASAVYLSNDIIDLEADRHHHSKRHRPFASGALPLPFGLFGAPALLLGGLGVAWALSWQFAVIAIMYCLIASGYSIRIKQLPLVDVFVLAGLYTLRLIAGHVATGIAYSPWLLMFSMFVFLSLALLKRFVELHSLRQQNLHAAKGRGYTASDLELVAMLGVVSGFLAVLVMALYVNSEQVRALYLHPLRLLLVCPLLLFWVSRVWFIAHRGRMHDDPITFVFKDWTSYSIGAAALAVMWLATGH